jgi:hypothetical protein
MEGAASARDLEQGRRAGQGVPLANQEEQPLLFIGEDTRDAVENLLSLDRGVIREGRGLVNAVEAGLLMISKARGTPPIPQHEVLSNGEDPTRREGAPWLSGADEPQPNVLHDVVDLGPGKASREAQATNPARNLRDFSFGILPIAVAGGRADGRLRVLHRTPGKGSSAPRMSGTATLLIARGARRGQTICKLLEQHQLCYREIEATSGSGIASLLVCSKRLPL